MTEQDDDKGFLSRWSYRKALETEKKEEGKQKHLKTDDHQNLEITKENQLDNLNHGSVVETEIDQGEKQETDEEKEMAENLAAAEAVDLESLDYNSDYQVFMKKGVPEVLKNQAMRKLWTSNPVLANVDGLNDYDENFADPALNTFKSIWQVGKGYLTDEDRHEPINEAVSSLAEPEDEATNATDNSDQSSEQKDISERENQSDEQDDQNVQEAVVASENEAINEDALETVETTKVADEIEPQRVSIRSRLFET